MFIFAAITTIKQSNLHPCQVISKLPSTSTVQAASENKQKFPLFTEKRGDYMKLFRHMYILTMYILQYRMGMFSLGLSVVGAVKKKKKERRGKKDNQGVKLLQSAGFWEKMKMQFDNPYVLLYRSRLSGAGSKCGISPKIYFHLPSLESVMCVQWRHVNLSVPYLPLVSVHTSFCCVLLQTWPLESASSV